VLGAPRTIQRSVHREQLTPTGRWLFPFVAGAGDPSPTLPSRGGSSRSFAASFAAKQEPSGAAVGVVKHEGSPREEVGAHRCNKLRNRYFKGLGTGATE
jgi:hypothetical protein